MNELIEEAKRLTKQYAAQNDCYASLGIEYAFIGNEPEEMHCTLYANPYKTFKDGTRVLIQANLEDLIQKLKTLVTQDEIK